MAPPGANRLRLTTSQLPVRSFISIKKLASERNFTFAPTGQMVLQLRRRRLSCVFHLLFTARRASACKLPSQRKAGRAYLFPGSPTNKPRRPVSPYLLNESIQNRYCSVALFQIIKLNKIVDLGFNPKLWKMGFTRERRRGSLLGKTVPWGASLSAPALRGDTFPPFSFGNKLIIARHQFLPG